MLNIASYVALFGLATVTMLEATDSDSFKRNGTMATRRDPFNIGENDDFIASIIGGKEIEIGSRPYLVMTRIGRYLVCGASLITPQVVLTAAHCNYYKGNYDPPTYVELNRHDFYDDAGVVSMNLADISADNMGDIIEHPDYDYDSFENDVSLYFLPFPIGGITPVKLNYDSSLPEDGDSLDIAGWGQTEDEDEPGNFTYPDVPFAATVGYITNEECKEYYGDLIFPDMMCIMESGKSDCYGDSGGPAVMGNPEGGPASDPALQVGIISWGTDNIEDGTCDLSYPSVYTRVSAHADWIAETVCERTGELCDNVKPPETSRSKASKRSKSGKGKKTKREKKGKSEE